MGTFRKRGSKVGLAPGTLVHIGEKKVEKVIIKIVVYNSEKFVEKELNSIDECLAFKDQPGTNLWINVDGLDQIEVIEKIGSYFQYPSSYPRRCAQYRAEAQDGRL